MDIDARIDHRTLEAPGIDLEPHHKIGPAASRMPEQALPSQRVEDHARIPRENGSKILCTPQITADAIARPQSTYPRRHQALSPLRHSAGNDEFNQTMHQEHGA